MALGLPERLFLGLTAAAAAWGLVEISMNADSQTPEECVSDEDRELVRAIMLDAVDIGLKNQTVHMYEIWLQDNTAQPSRAIQGMKNGITAYIRTRKAALEWAPPRCK